MSHAVVPWNCKAVMDVLGDNLLYFEHVPSRIGRHDVNVHLLAADIAKVARHPIVETRSENTDNVLTLRHSDTTEFLFKWVGKGAKVHMWRSPFLLKCRTLGLP